MTLPRERLPRATYRLQFSAGFRFADAARLAPCLARLGISHVYASPVFAARPGSAHGYDIVDHGRLNPELGTAEDFRAMAAAFRAEGLGLILDFVPNHMGIGGASNRAWLDVLEWGERSPFAPWFDIDWTSTYPGVRGRLLFPFLGLQYGEALAGGELELLFDAGEGSFAVWAHGTHKLPVCPRDYGAILGQAGLDALAAGFETAAAGDYPPGEGWNDLKAGLAEAARDELDAARIRDAAAAFRGRTGELASWAPLDALIDRQNWRAAKFDLDGDAINYRRFFTISDLVALRVEVPEVFDAIHALVLDLLAEGLIDGIRIDHIDGLRDPKGYLARLRERAARPFYLPVEKILAPGETLPESWDADGTTGYEVANLLAGLLADPDGTGPLSRLYACFTGREEPPGEIVRAAKREILAGPMAVELAGIVSRLHAIAETDPMTRDLGRTRIRIALMETIAALGVYRTYADADGIAPACRNRIAAAVSAARDAAPEIDPQVFDFLERALTLDLAEDRPALRQDILDTVLRTQQLTGPVMAKGLEDTALYRYNRLIALNEVGSEPGHFHHTVAEFHRANARRLGREPGTMLTTSTHDTKRGEDARARILALTAHVPLWARAVADWRGLLQPEAGRIDPNEEYFFYQLLLGAWPMEWRRDTDIPAEALAGFRERIDAAMLKSVREAKVNTRWVFGDPAYEAAVSALVARALDPSGAFLPAFRAFEAAVAPDACRLALVQTALRLTIPGIPDTYQGAELWEQSLVDPDNRRPVDFAHLGRMLDALDPAAPLAALDRPSGAAKLALTARLLGLRRERPALFRDGEYQPLDAGPEEGRLCAFARRRGDGELVVIADLTASPAQRPEAAVCLPGGSGRGWLDLAGGGPARGRFEASRLADFPVALLVPAQAR